MSRHFNKVAVILLIVTGVSSMVRAQQFGALLKDTPGIVSYTYRNSFQKDVALTLDTIRALGITNIEFSNLFGKTAAEIRVMLDARGMRCTSLGVSYADATSKTVEVGENARSLGASYVRIATVPFEGEFKIDDARKAVTVFNSIGKVLKEKYNVIFCYHNHGYEFRPYENGTLYDYIVQNTNAEFVSFELDVLWAFHPGGNPEALLHKYGSRYKLMHVKDLKKGVKGDSSGRTPVENDVALGTGQIDIAAVVRAGVLAGVKNFYIEDESNSVKVQVPESLKFLKRL